MKNLQITEDARRVAKKTNRTDLERLAYNMGKVERGLNNPNSRVFELYKNGKTGKTSSKRKPLI